MPSVRPPSIFDRKIDAPMRRGLNSQEISEEPRSHLTTRFPFAPEAYDTYAQQFNQLGLYDQFKLSVLKRMSASALQDAISKTGIISAAINHYIATCSTTLTVRPGATDGFTLFDEIFGGKQGKEKSDQIFDLLIKRGGAVYEITFGKGTYIPKRLKVHDPQRFDYQLIDDPEVRGGQKWALGLIDESFGARERFKRIKSDFVRYIAWRPKSDQKPFGTPRVSASIYYAAVLVRTISLVTDIFSKAGNPVLPITIDPQKMYLQKSGMSTPIYSGNVEEIIKQRALELRKTIPELGENDALILSGECELGEYLTPATHIRDYEAWGQNLEMNAVRSMGVHPAVIGIVQKSASLDNTATRDLIIDFKNACNSDQLLVSESFESICRSIMQLNEFSVRRQNQLSVSYEFSNPEEQEKLIEIRQKNAQAMKASVDWISSALEKGIITEAQAQIQYEHLLTQFELQPM